MNTTAFLQAFLLSVACAVIAVTLIVLLSAEPIAAWWFRFGYKVGIEHDGNMEKKKWFFDPIWGCEKCFAGQLALWIYPLCHIRLHWCLHGPILGFPGVSIGMGGYSLICHLFAMLGATLYAFILSTYIQKLKAI